VKIYFDLCAIQRPLDTPDQVRINLEAEAVLGLITYCEKGLAEILSSEALLYEGEQSSLAVRKEHTLAVLAKAIHFVEVTEKEKERAAQLSKYGVKPLDALHLALAEAGRADYFCTCDDRLLRNARKISDLSVRVLNPLDLILEIER
jgi:predicted nucleic acid-binding protein